MSLSRLDAASKLMECAANLRASSVWKIRNPQRILPLEQLAPFFLTLFLGHNQGVMVRQCEPAVAVWESHRCMNVVTMKELTPYMGALERKFVTFNNFIKQIDPTLPFDDKDLVNAFCMLSSMAKCNQIVSCFGMLLLELLKKKMQITYNGENVVGWVAQDGTIDQEHESVKTVKMHVLQKDLTPAKAVKAVQAIRDGKNKVKGVHTICGARNSEHVWLTFVTESGKIYDMDLSAFQFGHFSPFPFIEEVTTDNTRALGGAVIRDSLCVPTVKGLRDEVYKLIDHFVAMYNQLSATGGVLETATLIGKFQVVVDQVFAQMDDLLPGYQYPNFFWEMMKIIGWESG